MATAKSKKRRKAIIFSLILVTLAGLTAFALLKRREPSIRVETEKVTRRNITETVVANGKIQPVRQVKISAEVSGEIIDLPVKEGQPVKKGDLIVRIKPDVYIAALNQAKASYEASVAGKAQAEAKLEQADADFKRNKDLFDNKLLSEADFDGFKAAYDVAKAQLDSAAHQVEMSKALVDSAKDSLDKTTIVSPLSGTVSKLSLEVGERVAGNTMMAGTEIMTVADLSEMEARVDLGEIDVVLVAVDQMATLEVDSFRDRKFKGTVSDIANSSEDTGTTAGASSTTSQDATKFQVKIRIDEKEAFHPGMSVTAEIETRSRTNVLSVPVQSVTTRQPKPPKGTNDAAKASGSVTKTSVSTNTASTTNKAAPSGSEKSLATKLAERSGRRESDAPKPIEVVFLVDGDRVKMVPVKRGINDDAHAEIVEGLSEGQEVVSGGYKVISRELEDGKKIRKGMPGASDQNKDTEKK